MAKKTVDRYAQRRRVTAFLIVALLVLLALLGALVWFFMKVSLPAGADRTVPITAVGGVSGDFGEPIYGFDTGLDGQFLRPHDVNVGPNGDLYVADSGNGRVLRLTPDGELVGRYGTMVWGPKQIDSPTGVAVGPDGRVYVADAGARGPHGKIIVLSPDLKTVTMEINFKPKDNPVMPRIYGDKLYVTSAGGVHIYSLDGALLREWGTMGRADGQFSFPNGIALLPDGTIVVAESNNTRLQFFDQRGKFLKSAGKPPAGPKDDSGQFGLPMGLVIDERGVMYLADAFEYKIRLLGPDGKEFGSIGDFGNAQGQLNAPGGLSRAADGSFWVADELNNRIVQLKITVPESALPAGVWPAESKVAFDASSLLKGSTCLWAIPLLIALVLTVFVVVRRIRAGSDDGEGDESEGDEEGAEPTDDED